ncbi:nmrA-like family domain-containing protein [Trichoderma breve]|uniref:NmrA-like family domain-containing protein n=1 Tax=Trichoderma breve TaxID=2034170 RepID=A0A9W9B4Q9_9HYPO|nr:nmrA-like family domain-containing protein [Trichoderma breve]KAJ4855722.1 nmrA-like family domain-containing protein [Trichoderma breve]
MAKLVVVTGITGVQGSSVADTFLQDPAYTIRGVTRNPESEAAKAWVTKGVEIVQGEFDDVKSLERAFQGANVIFGVTDFWNIWGNPLELRHGKNLADAAASAASTLERYVFSSMADATKSSGGKYTKLYHMDSKARAATYAQSLPALKDKFSQVQAPVYFQVGTEWGLPITPKKQPDGTYRMIGPGAGHKPIPFGNVRTDLGPCVKALVEQAPPNTNLFAVGEYLSWTDYLRIVCETQGVKYGGFDELSYEEINELLPGGLGHEFGLNVLFAFDFGYEGTEPGIVGPGKYGIRMTSFREYCEKSDFSAALNK